VFVSVNNKKRRKLTLKRRKVLTNCYLFCDRDVLADFIDLILRLLYLCNFMSFLVCFHWRSVNTTNEREGGVCVILRLEGKEREFAFSEQKGWKKRRKIRENDCVIA